MMENPDKVTVELRGFNRSSWWQDATGKRLFVITRLEYGGGSYPVPTGYEIFEKGNVDSPYVIDAKVWDGLVARAGIVPMK